MQLAVRFRSLSTIHCSVLIVLLQAIYPAAVIVIAGFEHASETPKYWSTQLTVGPGNVEIEQMRAVNVEYLDVEPLSDPSTIARSSGDV